MRTYSCLYCQTINKYKGVNYHNKYCNNVCQGRHKTERWYKTNKSLFDKGLLKSRSAIKRFVRLRDGENCAICNHPPIYNSKPLTMILDHIDGNATNNMPNNFRLTCPNCDTQLPTFKSRNKGKGRQSRGLKWYSEL